ncbi:nitroreductase family protein [Streptomyces sp. VRA16 Mangrove soil]|uniref:Acg family FMN-binding oxidoreductase n=1 Tax=Streptomyces sp. VRA16 Mangrove soil TaxID=2817434 RepID=UPI001A9DC2CD|nr:nitroreductase family protein [Streptomyces sp. VRA16 Mangrove soil]MBO1337934.1 nitroreductase family protein [Streptomyces sp. VRA16 Mangrove soil]
MPATLMNAAVLETWLSAAVAAPSIFNTQPWDFRLDPDVPALDVRAARGRSLRAADPAGRALHLSVGAAVFNLRVAVARHGWVPVVRLLPRPDDPGLLARVRLEQGPLRGGDHRDDLYEAIWRRHSSRFPFADRPVPAYVRAELAEAAHASGAVLGFPAPAERALLLRITAEAEDRNRSDPERATESRRWVHREPADRADVGLPRATLGLQDAQERLPMRDFTAQRHLERLPAAEFERQPVIGLLSTAHDRRTDWLRAGQALQHVLLVATAHDLRTSLLHQAMEWPDLRRRMRPAPEHSGHVHMLVRLGYGPQGPAAPRRAPDRLLQEPVRHEGRV